MTPARRPLGPYPLESDRKSVKIPVKDGDAWAWVRIDWDELGRALGFRWRLDPQGYAVTTVYDVRAKKATRLPLHRMIARAPAGVFVDHKRHNLLDCRRSVLRWATPSQNSANARRHRRHSAKYRGVVRHRCGKYQAQAKRGETNHYLGLFLSEEEAAAAYNRKAKELWGPFAILNRVGARKAA